MFRGDGPCPDIESMDGAQRSDILGAGTQGT